MRLVLWGLFDEANLARSPMCQVRSERRRNASRGSVTEGHPKRGIASIEVDGVGIGDFEVRGEATGRVWLAHIARALPLPGSGERRKGESADGELVLLHTLPKEEMYADDLKRARGAVAIAQLPEVCASPVIRQLIDTKDDEYAMTLIWEWADISLHDLLSASRGVDIDAAQAEVTYARHSRRCTRSILFTAMSRRTTSYG